MAGRKYLHLGVQADDYYPFGLPDDMEIVDALGQKKLKQARPAKNRAGKEGGTEIRDVVEDQIKHDDELKENLIEIKNVDTGEDHLTTGYATSIIDTVVDSKHMTQVEVVDPSGDTVIP